MVTNTHGVGLELKGVTKRYGAATALAGIDLTIEPGEFMTFLGPSGSGKTTTLNIIAGFVEPEEGEVWMDGRPLVGLPPHKRDIGVVFQNYSLFPHLRVEENVAFPLRERKLKKAEIQRKVGDILETVGLEHLAKRYPRELSGGQQQRVALARALVFEPGLLLLDEPLGALDKKLRESLQLEISRIHKEFGVTFIFVTHDQEEALVMSDRIAVFNEGKLEHVADAHKLYERPRTLFAAQFIGNSNVIEGLVERSATEWTLSSNGLKIEVPQDTSFTSDRASLVIRPERVKVFPARHELPPQLVSLPGTISQVVYLGGRRRFYLDVQGREFLADEMAPDFDHQVGDAVYVAWDPKTTILVPPSPGQQSVQE